MKGLAFEDSPYVKAYTEDTAEFLMMSAEARGFYWLLYRAVNRSGIMLLGGIGREFAHKAVARRLSAGDDYARRSIDELIEHGFLTWSEKPGKNALVIVEYVEAQNTRMSDKAKMKEYRQRKHAEAVASSRPNPAPSVPNRYSPLPDVPLDQARRDSLEEKEILPYGKGECEGGKPPKTDPTPTLRKQQFDDLVGKGPASWGLEGSDKPRDLSGQVQAKTASPEPEQGRRDAIGTLGGHPDGETEFPSPVGRSVATPEPKFKDITLTSAKQAREFFGAGTQVGERAAALFHEPPAADPAKQKKARRRTPQAAAGDPPQTRLPDDWKPNEGHYKLGAEKYGLSPKHVDFEADEFRDHADRNQRMERFWDACFRTWLRKGWVMRKGQPPMVPEPAEPRRPAPPAPPPPLFVQERVAQIQADRAQGKPDLSPEEVRKRVHAAGKRFRDLPEEAVPSR